MTVREACEKAGVDLEELYNDTEEYFKAKMARKQYHKYKHNTLAQKRLYEDCLRETLLSKASMNGNLAEILTGGNNGKM